MVAPVRWATPGTDVDCAWKPWRSAVCTIQSARTPPPSPPIARTAIFNGRMLASGCIADLPCSQAALQRLDDGIGQPARQPLEPASVANHFDAIEGRAEHGCMGHFPAVPACDAAGL